MQIFVATGRHESCECKGERLTAVLEPQAHQRRTFRQTGDRRQQFQSEITGKEPSTEPFKFISQQGQEQDPRCNL